MVLSPLLRMQLCPNLCYLFNQSRNVRPTIKIGKEKFQLQLDVRNYDKDEIRVKARPEYVVIEGKQQKQTKRGLVMRQFIRKFRLPSGCVMENMESKLAPDGILTITAPRRTCESNVPCETLIPIQPDFPQKDQDVSFVPVQEIAPNEAAVKPNPCEPSLQTKRVAPPEPPSSPPSDTKK